MTAGELRERLARVPDDATLFVYVHATRGTVDVQAEWPAPEPPDPGRMVVLTADVDLGGGGRSR